MLHRSRAFHTTLMLIALSAIVSGCASEKKTTSRTTTRGVPPLASSQGALHIDIVYPIAGTTRPAVDSNFIFGSVGSSTAQLWINGHPVEVAKNGAFLAYLPTPALGYAVVAIDGAKHDSLFVEYGDEAGGSQSDAGGASSVKRPRTSVMQLRHPMIGQIITGGDTLQTGSDVTPATPEPGADRKWQWPRGARFLVVAKSGSELETKLSNSEEAWIADTSVSLSDSVTSREQTVHEIATEVERQLPRIRVLPALKYDDVIFSNERGTFLVESAGNKLIVSLYHRSIGPQSLYTDALIAGIGLQQKSTTLEVTIALTNPVWGYKAFYNESGELVLRIRRAPTIDTEDPLKGLHIMIDPGHPPGGAIGPTRLTEAEANLAIGLRVRGLLESRGAIVEMTRTTNEGMRSSTVQSTELWARADSAVRGDADLLISIHNNGFPDGVDPFSNEGTSTYYFNEMSQGLAEALDREIVDVTGIPDLGAHKRSLAMVRPTWMPAVLTESLYMMFPDQEAALRDDGFLNRLAEAHVRGIEAFLKSRMARP